jgi:predicted SAM-dependent methyltransferase
MKLNLGCYEKKMYGFVNVDIREDVKPDVVDDVFLLDTFENNSANLIYACHVLEHTNYKNAEKGLKRWFDVLKEGGTLRISVPDLESVFEHYIYHKDVKTLKAFLYGSQRHDYDYHLCGFDEKLMTEILTSIGFENIKKYDWRETEHFYIDDYSQAYLPEISYKTRRKDSEIKGRLMSLNIEATKPKKK